MVSWFLIIIGTLVGLFIVYMLSTSKHHRRRPRVTMILLLIAILFLVSTIYLVSKANKVDMTTVSGFSDGMKVYSIWLFQGFNNLRSISGYAVAMDWKGNNSTANTSAVKTINQTKIDSSVKNITVTDKPVPVSTKNKMVPKPLK